MHQMTVDVKPDPEAIFRVLPSVTESEPVSPEIVNEEKEPPLATPIVLPSQ